MSYHIVTGATGFVGSAILLELLSADDNSEIWCLARSNKKQDAEERIFNSLQNIRLAYGLPGEIPQEIRERCHVLPGDITQEMCGISTQQMNELPSIISTFWHCAASLNYENRFKEEIQAINIGGTRETLALAHSLGVEHFNYISTSYVAGTRLGLIPEELMVQDQQTNNWYEHSKIQAELLVAAEQDLRPCIMRPSVVIGHSQTYAPANSYSGLYGFMRRIAKSIAIMERLDKFYLRENALKMRFEPAARLNLIPIDYVARQAIAIGLHNAHTNSSLVYHLTNATPILVQDFLSQMFTYLNLFPPIPTRDTNEWSEIDKEFAKNIDFYNSYLLYPKHFDRTRADTLLIPGQESFLLSKSVMQEYFDWYLTYLAQTDPNTLRRAHLTSKVKELVS